MASAGSASMSQGLRQKVLWLGPQIYDGVDLKEFENRRLVICYDTDENSIKNALPTLKGIILVFNPSKPGTFQDHLRKYGPVAIDHGIALYQIADHDDDILQINSIHKSLSFSYQLNYPRTKPSAAEVAEYIARHPPSPAPNPSLKIECDPAILNEIKRLLFQRAFSDCDAIHVKKVPGGRSAKVFAVYPVLTKSEVGPRPLPFFAKFDTKEKIEKELYAYDNYVTNFVPFYLRPNFDRDRCIVGYESGIIVGNYAEQTETLLDEVGRGQGLEPINCLIDSTLSRWWEHAQRRDGNLTTAMQGFFNPGGVTEKRRRQCKELGATRCPEDLYKMLLQLPAQSYLDAPIHGDLHAKNIIVRGTDAILIDFQSAQRGPIVIDLATLDVSLSLEVTDKEKDANRWRKLVDDVYSVNVIRNPSSLSSPSGDKLIKCIKKIRETANAKQQSQYEYVIAVAVILLRSSTHPGKLEQEKYRLAYAYILAEKIILNIAKKLGV